MKTKTMANFTTFASSSFLWLSFRSLMGFVILHLDTPTFSSLLGLGVVVQDPAWTVFSSRPPFPPPPDIFKDSSSVVGPGLFPFLCILFGSSPSKPSCLAMVSSRLQLPSGLVTDTMLLHPSCLPSMICTLLALSPPGIGTAGRAPPLCSCLLVKVSGGAPVV